VKNRLTDLVFRIPIWLQDHFAHLPEIMPDLSQRMNIAIELSRLNIENRSGGPFGAAVFSVESHRLISVGTNLVVSANASILHAEIVALTLAQQKLGSYNLNSLESETFELVTSTEPCAMCFGAIHWSGIRKLICGAREKDAQSIGFDEGPKTKNWDIKLQKNGISVIKDVCRENAIEILRQYQKEQGIIYNV
jgi:tRNA(Arg) A34 adenosine deaminase TadA